MRTISTPSSYTIVVFISLYYFLSKVKGV